MTEHITISILVAVLVAVFWASLGSFMVEARRGGFDGMTPGQIIKACILWPWGRP